MPGSPGLAVGTTLLPSGLGCPCSLGGLGVDSSLPLETSLQTDYNRPAKFLSLLGPWSLGDSIPRPLVRRRSMLVKVLSMATMGPCPETLLIAQVASLDPALIL